MTSTRLFFRTRDAREKKSCGPGERNALTAIEIAEGFEHSCSGSCLLGVGRMRAGQPLSTGDVDSHPPASQDSNRTSPGIHLSFSSSLHPFIANQSSSSTQRRTGIHTHKLSLVSRTIVQRHRSCAAPISSSISNLLTPITFRFSFSVFSRNPLNLLLNQPR